MNNITYFITVHNLESLNYFLNYKNDNDILKDVNFSIDNFAKECKNIENSNITLEITATDEEDKTTIYKVPLSMNKSCN